MSDALRTTAATYLAALAEGGDLPGGVMFRDLLGADCLEVSLAGLQQIDALLLEMHERDFNLAAVWDEPSFHNFAFCLGFQVAHVIATVTGTPVGYLTREELAERMPDLDGPDDLSLVFGLETMAGMHLPLHAISTRLRGEGGSVWYAAACHIRDIQRVLGEDAPDPDLPDGGEFIAEVKLLGDEPDGGSGDLGEVLMEYVSALTGMSTIPGGIAYLDKIDGAQLDGSLASLLYVDRILLRLHQGGIRVGPLATRADFANLIRALGAYCVLVITSTLDLDLPVLSGDGFRAAHPDLADDLPYDLTSVFVLRGVRPEHLMLPLAPVIARIDRGADESVHRAVEEQIAGLLADLQPRA